MKLILMGQLNLFQVSVLELIILFVESVSSNQVVLSFSKNPDPEFVSV